MARWFCLLAAVAALVSGSPGAELPKGEAKARHEPSSKPGTLIVGRWESVDPRQEAEVYEFNADGTGRWTYKGRQGPQAFRYRLLDERTFKASEDGKILEINEDGKVLGYAVEVTRDTLTLAEVLKKGKGRGYRRVK
jgi:hypothetical protein